MSVEFIFPLPPKDLHPNSRVSWQAKSRAKAGYRYEVCIEAKRQLGMSCERRLMAPITAYTTFAFNVNRKRDEDNLLAWCKSLFDGLVDARVLAGDDSKSLHHAPITVLVDKTLKAPEVRVRLEGSE